MEKEKIQRLVKFYLLATELKDKIRSGWKVWNVDKERLESVAEHIYGTCILAVAIDSEYNLGINLYKVILMLVLHELEEIKIGDLTPFDRVTKEEKRVLGDKAVEEVLDGLCKKEEYIDLITEFEDMKTKEAIFAKMCDKLEANIQCKKYCEEGNLDLNNLRNKDLLEDVRIKKLLDEGAKTVADLYIENDRPIYVEQAFMDVADFIKNNDILDLK